MYYMKNFDSEDYSTRIVPDPFHQLRTMHQSVGNSTVRRKSVYAPSLEG